MAKKLIEITKSKMQYAYQWNGTQMTGSFDVDCKVYEIEGENGWFDFEYEYSAAPTRFGAKVTGTGRSIETAIASLLEQLPSEWSNCHLTETKLVKKF